MSGTESELELKSKTVGPIKKPIYIDFYLHQKLEKDLRSSHKVKLIKDSAGGHVNRAWLSLRAGGEVLSGSAICRVSGPRSATWIPVGKTESQDKKLL